MAVEVEKLIVTLEARFDQYNRALAKGQADTNKKLGEIERRFQQTSARVRQSSLAMGTALGGIGAYLGVRAVADYANSWTRLTRSIDAGGRTFGIVLKPAEELNELANDARIDAEAYTKTYIRTAAAIRDYGYDSEAAAKITSTLAKALKLGSASASEQASTILQFSQALQKGKLDGDEFRTVMENAGVVQELLAERLGVTKGEIVKMAAEGKLQIQDLAGAMLDGGAKIERIFRQMPATIDEAFTVLRNNVVQFIGQADQATGASQAVSDGIVNISKNLDILAVAVGAILGSAALRMSAFAAATVAAANPLTLLAAAVGALATGYGVFGDQIKVSDDGMVSLRDSVEAFAKVAGEDAYNAIAGITRSLDANRKAVAENKSAWGELASEVADRVRPAFDALVTTISTGLSAALRLVPSRYTDEARQVSNRRSLEQKDYGAGLGNYLEGKLDYQPKPPGTYGAEKKSQYEREVDAIKKRTAALQAELQVIDATTYARERSKAAAELQHALAMTAAKEGRAVTTQEQAAIGKLADAYAKAAVQVEFLQKLQDARLENEDLQAEIELTGLYGEELEKARKQQELLTEAKRAGIDLTPAMRAEIDMIAERRAQLEETQKTLDRMREQSSEVLKGFITDLRDGKGGAEALSNSLMKISDQLIDMAVNKLVESALGGLFGGASGGIGASGSSGLGGLLTGLLSFSEGGAVQGPGTGTSDSIPARLSNGEFVVNAEATRKHRALLEAINGGAGVPAFANGGSVNMPRVAVPSISAAVPVAAAPSIAMSVTIHAPNATPAGVDALNNTTVPKLKQMISAVVDEKFSRQARYRKLGAS
ncbi:MAG: tape measure protein [Hyphomicrobium sp.]|uniref:tape measure protein n=1 Tax=Hyphomicrobium sp. TaxID=82 RepID=UPI003D112CFF